MAFTDGNWIVPIGTIIVTVFIQVLVRGWAPAQTSYEDVEPMPEVSDLKTEGEEESNSSVGKEVKPEEPSIQMEEKTNTTEQESDEDLFAMNENSGWRCACEGGFLPPGMLKSFGGAEAMMRLGTGQCYHKEAR